MIELKVTANTSKEMLDQLLDISYMMRACLEGTCCDEACAECPCDDVSEATVETVTAACPASVAGSVEYEDVDTAVEPAKEPAKRTRKKKEPVAEPVKEVEPAAEQPEVKAEVASTGKLSQTDVREILVKTRDRVGMDKVRMMLANFGGSLANCPEADWPKVVEAANALGADDKQDAETF